MTTLDRLLAAQRPFLTDGGFETWLFFVEGLEAPEFAAITLMENADALPIMRRYFERYLSQAQSAGTGFVLDTNTWRGAPAWAEKLGRSEADMLRLNREAVRFARAVKEAWTGRVDPIVLNGVIGPVGDAYAVSAVADAEAARTTHQTQIDLLADEGVEMISALTIGTVDEAVGIALAAQRAALPVVISYTVETDGRLPSGPTLGDAIRAADDATGGAPIYYMVNCAHPEHFRDALAAGEDWIERIGGVRANASRLSHAELDASETLDDGDPEDFGAQHSELARLLPNLRVVGGCCGTDHRHVGCVSRRLHAPETV